MLANDNNSTGSGDTQAIDQHSNKNLSLDQVRPNDWNPNRMTAEEFGEYVAEVRHLGKPPKPLVLRKQGEGYQIVDGEHAYQALKELGYTELQPDWYTVEAYDDFEAMRQTYKRNQHGTHDPVKQGELFKRMMTERGLSQRELAREMEVSEGTVRNSYAYLEAVEARRGNLRNGYAELISGLTVRQVRALNEMPLELGNLWLIHGARPEDLPAGDYDKKLVELIPVLNVHSCKTAVEKIRDISEGLRLWGYYQRLWGKNGQTRVWTGGLKLDSEQALPYLKLYFDSRWKQRDATALREMLKAISHPEGEGAKIVLPLETFEAWIDYPDAMSHYEFVKKLKQATIESAPWTEGRAFHQSVWEQQLQVYAPAIIRDSGLPKETAYKLWQGLRTYEEDHVDKKILEEALHRALIVLQNEKSIEPDEVLAMAIRDLTHDDKIEAELTSFGDKSAMLANVKELLTDVAKRDETMMALFHKVGEHSARKRLALLKKSMQPMLDRLALLPEPELALITAMLTGKGNALEVWATALGWKFEKPSEDKGAE